MPLLETQQKFQMKCHLASRNYCVYIMERFSCTP